MTEDITDLKEDDFQLYSRHPTLYSPPTGSRFRHRPSGCKLKLRFFGKLHYFREQCPIETDKSSYPMSSNGNLIEQGEIEEETLHCLEGPFFETNISFCITCRTVCEYKGCLHGVGVHHHQAPAWRWYSSSNEHLTSVNSCSTGSQR